jgi:hypothetical protein
MALRKQEFDDNEEQSSKSKKRPRITIDVTPELRRRIKIAASQNDLSISEYIGKILDEVLPEEVSATPRERRYATPEFLQKVLQVRERIMQESNGELFEDAAELVRKMREERTEYLDEVLEES